MIEVRRFVNASGTDIVAQWLSSLKDDRARARINIRIARIAAGNFGDCKMLRKGILELRIDYGPGYRVYFSRISPASVLLLGGGMKQRQSRDIAQAINALVSYQKRNA